MSLHLNYWLFSQHKGHDPLTLITIDGGVYNTSLTLTGTTEDPYSYVHIAREDRSFIGDEVLITDLPDSMAERVKAFLFQ